jgi:flavin-binding protein dodecin
LRTTIIININPILGHNFKSERGWSEAAKSTLDEANKTIRGITGLEVVNKTGKVDSATGKITEYRLGVKIAFGVEH